MSSANTLAGLGCLSGEVIQTSNTKGSELSAALSCQTMIVPTVHLELLLGTEAPKYMITNILLLVSIIYQEEYTHTHERWKKPLKIQIYCLLFCLMPTIITNSNNRNKNKIALLKLRNPKISNREAP